MNTNEQRPATAPVLCFGEVLWDVLPDGPHLGGAPLNVAWHIARHGLGAAVVSAVGDDDLGRRAVREIAAGGVDTSLIRILPDAPTGTVKVALDDDGDASYHFPDDVAWDHIEASGETAAAAGRAGALVYGSLAMRGRPNRAALSALLDQVPPSCLVVMDVNLRPPFRQRAPILDLARRASVLKLNLSELEFLLDRRLDDHAAAGGPGPDDLAELHRLTGCQACCLTLGENGAMWWRHGHPPSSFRHRGHVGLYPLANTIGAGDSFLASLVSTLLRSGGIDEAALDRAGRVAAFVTSSPSATPDYDPDQLPPPESPRHSA